MTGERSSIHMAFRLRPSDVEALDAIGRLRDDPNRTRALKEALEFYRRALEKRAGSGQLAG